MCKLLTFCLSFIPILLFNIGRAMPAEQLVDDTISERVSSEKLPSFIIAYSVFCSGYPNLNINNLPLDSLLARLGKNIDALPGGISTGLGFTHRAFILQSEIIGSMAGFLREKNKTLEESKVPFEGILFVTTPIPSFGKRVIAIVSSVSPEETSILAIDDQLKAELLYDSFKKNEIKNMKDIRGSKVIGSVFNVRTKSSGVFLLQERMQPGGRGMFSPYENRTFMIDVSKGNFVLSITNSP